MQYGHLYSAVSEVRILQARQVHSDAALASVVFILSEWSPVVFSVSVVVPSAGRKHSNSTQL